MFENYQRKFGVYAFKKNYRILDTFDQNYMVFQNIKRFKSIENIDMILPDSFWKMSKEICVYVNNLQEELVESETLINDNNPSILRNWLINHQFVLILQLLNIQHHCIR